MVLGSGLDCSPDEAEEQESYIHTQPLLLQQEVCQRVVCPFIHTCPATLLAKLL